MDICSIALTLLLMVVSVFLTLISIIYDSKEIVHFKLQSLWNFYEMVKIRVIIISNVNILTINETLFQNVIDISPTIHQNLTKVPG